MGWEGPQAGEWEWTLWESTCFWGGGVPTASGGLGVAWDSSPPLLETVRGLPPEPIYRASMETQTLKTDLWTQVGDKGEVSQMESVAGKFQGGEDLGKNAI